MRRGAGRRAALAALTSILIVPSPGLAQEETLSVSFTTSQTSTTGPGGVMGFAPSSYAVVWLEDSSGEYVETLGRWGENFWYDLRDWALSSGFDVDAVSGATRTSHGPLSISGAIVSDIPDGTYDLVMELTDWELPEVGQNNVARFVFVKDGTPSTPSPSPSGGFSGISIVYSGRTGGNYPPGVDAGHEIWVTLPATPTMDGVATDDGGTPSVTWTQIDGPAGVAFADANDPTTGVSFPGAGRYVLRLTASDGARSSSDDVTVWVNATVIEPEADAVVSSSTPSVNNGGFRWMNVNDTNQGYVRFALGSLPGPVSGAILRLSTAEGGYSSVLREIHRVSDDSWGEMTITWSTRPAADPASAATIGTDRGWVEATITSLVQAEVAGDSVLSLNLRPASTPSQWVLYNTKDCSPSRMDAHYAPPEIVVFTEMPSTPSIAVSLSPASASEGSGVLSGAGSFTLSVAPTTDLVVTLASADASALTVPAAVTVASGAVTAAFDLTVVDDATPEPDQVVAVTASAAGFIAGASNFTVLDDDAAPEEDEEEVVEPADSAPDTGPDAVTDPLPDVVLDPPADASDGGGGGGCGCRLVS